MATGKGFNVKLNSGYECPIMGYGTWQSTDVAQLKAGIKAAIQAGYRHIDTAFCYGNEAVIGETLQELYDTKVVKREDLFITTKIFPTHFRPDQVMPLLKKELEMLKTSYVDLYLMHYPVPLFPPAKPGEFVKMTDDGKVALDLETKHEHTWAALEKCVDAGLTRSIGVSSFNIKQVDHLLKWARIKPSMNQVECHPAFQNKKLIDFCQKNGVAITAYSQFGSPGSQLGGKVFCDLDILHDERIVGIGKKYGKNAAQVILRWLIQQNVIVIPKSLTPSRIVENFQVWDFKLTDEDMKAMAAIDANKRYMVMSLPGLTDHPEYPFLPDGSSC